MTARRLFPHRVIGEDDVAWDAWWYERDGIRMPLPTLLPGWDYSRAESFGVTITIDGAAVLESTGLHSLSLLKLALLVDCPASGRRYCATERLTEDPSQQMELSVDLPPGEVADKLELSVHLVLATDTASRPRIASVAGARLGSSPKFILTLEGESSRFPTDSVSFADVGLEPAPWTLSTSFVELDDSFMGAVRLLINEAHPLGVELLSGYPDGSASERLKIDVLRMLVSITCHQVPDGRDEFDDDSVGGVVSRMCELFLNRSLQEASALFREEPLRFERLCYQAVAQ
ncbi:hypothetical protein [Nocardioides taihuensis]|uniref:ApeA N-terminal domain-containing protein n=1 Tax=Nocardioides taihuensis TaxID=1835606 RepID=A0ABW0BKR4_9ACTN